MKKTILILAVIWVSLGFGQTGKYKYVKDIPYYPDSVNMSDEYIKEKCKLDIYYPEEKENYPVVVWFHGGGLTGGEKEIPERLKNQGFAVIGVGYRLSPKATAPAYVDDAAMALAWVFKNIQKYGGDRNLIFVSGYSAGGYLALMVGLDSACLGKHGIKSSRIAGIISFSGQTITHFTVRKERGIDELTPVIDSLAPLFYVKKDAPPLLLLTGDREMELFGRYEENAYLSRMMKLKGHQNTRLYEFEGYGHGMLEPGYPLLINEVIGISKLKKKNP